MRLWHWESILLIKYWISRICRWTVPLLNGRALTASAILAGINPVPDLISCLWRRGTGRLRDGSDSRQIKGQRLALRYHCHDRTVFFKLTDGWRPRQCADLQPGDHFENGFLESVVPKNLTPYMAVVILAVITLVCKVLSGSVSENQIRLPVTGCW